MPPVTCPLVPGTWGDEAGVTRTLINIVQIVLLGVGAAILYGILHDQVTVRLSLEYFTLGHPDIFPTRDPTMLALGWGIIATWWVGLLLAVPAALVAQWGARPRVDAGQLLRPLLLCMVIMGILAVVAALAGFVLTKAGWIWLIGPLATRIPPPRDALFLAAGWSHGASYLGGAIAGVGLWVYIWRTRRQREHQGDPLAFQQLRAQWEQIILALVTWVGGVGLALALIYGWFLAMLVSSGL